MIKIAPSLLSANLLRLEEQVEALIQAGADMIHLDVMDQHYVPNLTFGPAFCSALRKQFPQLLLDVHLMVTPVHELIEAFGNAGATRISIHPEACFHLDRELAFIAELGCQVGIALNPSTPIDCLEYIMDRLDFVLVMTVNPGFGGQKLLNTCIPKITLIKKTYPDLSISVDGGVNNDTIQKLITAGADTFVVGSGLFSTPDYKQTIQLLKSKT